ncbi:hypothetical protein J7K41_02245 [Candidatus Micrarchaeota archaeon]|nr:hypothetical protein [Candidatus Micrarchaeota archaeon]
MLPIVFKEDKLYLFGEAIDEFLSTGDVNAFMDSVVRVLERELKNGGKVSDYIEFIDEEFLNRLKTLGCDKFEEMLENFDDLSPWDRERVLERLLDKKILLVGRELPESLQTELINRDPDVFPYIHNPTEKTKMLYWKTKSEITKKYQEIVKRMGGPLQQSLFKESEKRRIVKVKL